MLDRELHCRRFLADPEAAEPEASIAGASRCVLLEEPPAPRIVRERSAELALPARRLDGEELRH